MIYDIITHAALTSPIFAAIMTYAGVEVWTWVEDNV